MKYNEGMENSGNQGGLRLLGKLRIRVAAGLTAFSLVVGAGDAAKPASLSMPEASPRWVDETLAKMSLEEKVGQMFMVGFQSYGKEKATVMNGHAKRVLNKYRVGGIILFDRNMRDPAQAAGLVRDLQRTALSAPVPVPLLIAADQEGGKISRMIGRTTPFPGNMALGATRNPVLAREQGRFMGRELRAMGINLNLAPVMDVNNNPDNPVIGVRSFGEDPRLVAEMGREMIRGFHEGGVLTAVKHFPGHGDTALDSHFSLPRIPHSRERLDRVELFPFKAAIEAGTDMVMSAHITFPAVEPQPGVPATLSERVLTGILRNELRFGGVIITDDMEMGAIADRYGPEQAAVRAVRAGADMILIAHSLSSQEEAIQAVIRAVRTGELSERRIDESVRRILRLKAKRLGHGSLLASPFPSPETAGKQVGSQEARQLAALIAEQSVTLVGSSGALPLRPDRHRRILVLAADRPEAIAGAFRRVGFEADSMEIGKIDRKTIPLLAARASASDAAVVAVSRVSRNPVQAELVEALAKSGKLVAVLGLDTPYDKASLPKDVPFIALYGSALPSMEAGVRLITGQIRPKGLLPVTLNQKGQAGR